MWTHKFSDQHVFSDRLLADLQIAHVGGNFTLDFPDPSLATMQRSFEITQPAGLWGRSFQQSIFDRPFDSVNANMSYFRPAMLGGDHAIRAGVGYRTADGLSLSHVGGNTTARFTAGVGTAADLHRDAATLYTSNAWSFFLQDTYTRGRFTAMAGLRVDRQDDKALGASVTAHPFVADLLPEATFGGVDPGIVWTNISPRLGVTFDPRGTGRTILRGSYSRYYGQVGPGTIAAALNPLTAVQLRLPWSDANADRFVQRNELNFSVAADADQRQLERRQSGVADDREPDRSGPEERLDRRVHRRRGASARIRPRGGRQLHLSEIRRLPLGRCHWHQLRGLHGGRGLRGDRLPQRSVPGDRPTTPRTSSVRPRSSAAIGRVARARSTASS